MPHSAPCLATHRSLSFSSASRPRSSLLYFKPQSIFHRYPFLPFHTFLSFRFCVALPDEYTLHILLEWITIEDLANFDVALLNHIDRRSYLSLLRDTEHKGVLSVSNKRKIRFNDGYKINSGIAEWLESRNVFVRALSFYDDDNDVPAGFLARTGRQLLKIDFNGSSGSEDVGVAELARSCPNLEDVCLSGASEVTDEGLYSLVTHCPNIHTLNIGGTRVTVDGLARLGQGCRALKVLGIDSLRISNISLGKIAESFPGLEEVNLSGSTNFTDAGLARLSQGCPGLRSIGLEYTQVTDQGLARLGEGCSALKTIALRGLAISDSGLANLAKACRGLEDVDLGRCARITGAGLAALVEYCPQLRSLKLCGMKHLADADLTRLTEGDIALKSIDLSFSVIGDAVLAKLAEAFPSLTNVSLYGCHSITDTGVARLAHFCPELQILNVSGLFISESGLVAVGQRCRSLETFGLETFGYVAIYKEGLRQLADCCPSLVEVNLFRCVGIDDAAIENLAQRCPKLRRIHVLGTQVTN
jgi:hypothetical protein